MNAPAALLLATIGACATAPTARHLGPVTGIAVAADGRVASCSQLGVVIGSDLHPWHRERPFALAWSPAGELAVVGGEPGSRGTIVVMSATGVRVHEQRAGDDVFYAVAVAADGRIAAGNALGEVWGGTLDRGAPPLAVDPTLRHTGPCRALAFSPDGGVLATGGRDGRLLLRDRGAATPREVLDHSDGIECLVWLDDQRLASGARDGRVRLHDREGRLLRTWHRLGAAVLALTTDGEQVFAGLADGRVVALRPGTDTAETRQHLPGPAHALAISSAGLLAGCTSAITPVDAPSARKQ